jgi:hypothetical protein
MFPRKRTRSGIAGVTAAGRLPAPTGCVNTDGVLFPLTLAGNVFMSPQTMPGWLQAIVTVNPVSHGRNERPAPGSRHYPGSCPVPCRRPARSITTAPAAAAVATSATTEMKTR